MTTIATNFSTAAQIQLNDFLAAWNSGDGNFSMLSQDLDAIRQALAANQTSLAASTTTRVTQTVRSASGVVLGSVTLNGSGFQIPSAANEYSFLGVGSTITSFSFADAQGRNLLSLNGTLSLASASTSTTTTLGINRLQIGDIALGGALVLTGTNLGFTQTENSTANTSTMTLTGSLSGMDFTARNGLEGYQIALTGNIAPTGTTIENFTNGSVTGGLTSLGSGSLISTVNINRISYASSTATTGTSTPLLSLSGLSMNTAALERLMATVRGDWADPSFGNQGETQVFSGAGGEPVNSRMVRLDNGKILLAEVFQQYATNGASTYTLRIARFNANGTADTSYGANSSGQYSMNLLDDDTHRYVLPKINAATGNVLVCQATRASGGTQVVTTRFNATGGAPTTLNGTSALVLPVDMYNFAAMPSLREQNDGKIVQAVVANDVVAGASAPNQTLYLVRQTSAGALDATGFGSGGVVTDSLGSTQFDHVFTMGYGSSDTSGNVGKILVALGDSGNASGAPGFTLERYTAAGVLDTTFSGDGRESLVAPQGTPPVSGFDARLLADGRILVLTTQGGGNWDQQQQTWVSTPPSVTLFRYTASGALDGGFGSNGMLNLPMGPAGGYNSPIYRFEPDGRLLVASASSDMYGGDGMYGEVGSNLTVARFNADGTPDTTFGGDGVVNATVNVPWLGVGHYPYGDYFGGAMASQPDGSVVLDANSGNNGASVIRIAPDGTVSESQGVGGSSASYVVEPGTGAIVIAANWTDYSTYANNTQLSRLTPPPALADVFNSTFLDGNDTITLIRDQDTRLDGYTGNDILTTGSGNDTLDGGAGNDTLNAGQGNDTLTGGVGVDRFIFSTALGLGNVDTVTDFTVGQDKFILGGSPFVGIAFNSNGSLATSALSLTGEATGSSAQIIYSSTSGALSYDADGTGVSGAVQFATLGTGLNLTAADFASDGSTFSISAGGASPATGMGTLSAEGAKQVFQVSRTGVTNVATTVNWQVEGVASVVSNGVATAADFVGATATSTATVLPSGSISFAVNETSKSITLGIAADTLEEGYEGYSVNLSLPSTVTGAAIDSVRGKAYAFIADPMYAITLDNPPSDLTEGSSWVFKVTRSNLVEQSSTVNWNLSGATFARNDISFDAAASNNDIIAAAGATVTGADRDALAMSGSIVFAAGETLRTLTIASVSDAFKEHDEGFSISLTAAAGSTVRADAASINLGIKNDDLTNDYAGATRESAFQLGYLNAGTAAAPVTLALPTWFEGGIETVGGADDPTDYYRFTAGTSGALRLNLSGAAGATFAAGANIDVDLENALGVKQGSSTLAGNTAEQINFNGLVSGQDYYVKVYSTSSVQSGYQLSLASIGVQSTMAITPLNAYRNEGNSGSSPFTFQVTRTGNLNAAMVNWTVGELSGGANASDFGTGTASVLPSGIVTFAASETSTIITVNVAGDTAFENDGFDESFTVNIAPAATDVLVTQSSATGGIRNDDRLDTGGAGRADAGDLGTLSVGASVTPVQGWVGADDTVDHYRFTADQTGAANIRISGLSADADLYIFDSTTATTAASVGYSANGGTTPDEVNLDVIQDATYYIEVRQHSGDTHYVLDASLSDAPAIYSIETLDSSRAENAGGAITNLTFTVSRTEAGRAGSVGWAVQGPSPMLGANGYAGQADRLDFAGGYLPTGFVSFTTGQTTATITLSVLADSNYSEGDETFAVSLFSPTGGQLGDSSVATGGILAGASADKGANTRALADAAYANNLFGFDQGGALAAGGTLTVSDSVSTVDDPADYFKFVAGAGGSVVLELGGMTTTAGADVQVQNSTGGFLGSNAAPFDVVAGQTYYVRVNPHSGATAYDLTLGLTQRETPRVWIEVGEGGALRAEGSSYSFVVRRDAAASALTVDYAVESISTALNPADFGTAMPAGSVSFDAGQTSATLTISTIDDTLVEIDESFAVRLSTASVLAPAYTLVPAGNVAVGVIQNNDLNSTAYRIEATIAGQSEGSGGSTPYVFNVRREGNLTYAGTASWALVAGSTNAADFGLSGTALPSGSVNFAANDSLATLTVSVSADSTVEPDEFFSVNLSNAVTGGGTVGIASSISTSAAGGRILNDDVPDTFAFAPDSLIQTATEGNPLTFTVNRSVSTGVAASVVWTLSHVSTLAADLPSGAPIKGTLSFAAGATSMDATIATASDALAESGEVFRVALSAPTGGASLGTSATVATGVVLDDDGILASSATIATVGVVAVQPEAAEDDAHGFVFELRRVGTALALGVESKVAYRLVPGTASAAIGAADNTDFDGWSLNTPYTDTDRVTFAAGVMAMRITVAATADSVYELDEQFKLELLSAGTSGAVLSTTAAALSATATIRNDDAPPLLSISSPGSLDEGSSGTATAPATTPFVFTVTRDQVTQIASTVRWAVQAPSSMAGDFVGGVLPSGTLTFSPLQQSATVTVGVKADFNVEDDETFAVVLSSPTNARLSDTPRAMATIVNDDVAPTFSIAAAVSGMAEGNSGTTPFVYTVSRTGNANVASEVGWSVAGDGNDSLTKADFSTPTVMPSGSIIFAAGEIAKTLTVNVAGDNVSEGDERFRVMLSPTSNAAIGTGLAVSTVYNDDNIALAFLPSQATLAENASIAGSLFSPYVFTLNRSGLSPDANVTNVFSWSVVPSASIASTANSAAIAPVSPADFLGGILPTGVVTFGQGEQVQTITVNIYNDTVEEGLEGFRLEVGSVSGVSFASDQVQGVKLVASGVIQSDDVAPAASFSIAPIAADLAEGNTGTTPFTFRVTRSGNTAIAASVTWQVTDTNVDTQSSVSPSDFGVTNAVTLPSGTLSFAANALSQTITIAVRGDTTASEGDEAFWVKLTGGSSTAGAVTISTTADIASAVIRNDDIATPDYAGNTWLDARGLGETGATARVFADRVGDAGDDEDYYRFSLAASGSLDVTLSGMAVSTDADVVFYRWDYNGDDNVQDGEMTVIGANLQSGNTNEVIQLPYLNAGEYFARVYAYSGATPYSLSLKSTAIPDLAGNTMSLAKAVTPTALPQSFNDFIGGQDNQDYYKFTTTASTRFSLSMAGMTGNADVHLINSSGFDAASTLAGTSNEAILIDSLAAGTYYAWVMPSGDASTFYNLTVSAEVLEAANRAYNTTDTAKVVSLSTTAQLYADSVGNADPQDYYKFTLTSPARFELGLTSIAANADVDVELLDTAGNRIAASASGGNLAESIVMDGLAVGTYYVRVYPVAGASPYSLSLKGTPVTRSDAGGNVGTPVALTSLGATVQTKIDYVGSDDPADFYKFTVGSGVQRLAVDLTGLTGDLDVVIQNANGIAIDPGYFVPSDAGHTDGPADESFDVLFGSDINELSALQPGDYYIKVQQGSSDLNSSSYRLEVSLQDNQDADLGVEAGSRGIPESGGKDITDLLNVATASTLSLIKVGTSTTYTDFVGSLDRNDYYKFTLAGPRLLKLGMDKMTANADVELLDASGALVAASRSTGITAETIGGTSGLSLAAGDYYVHVSRVGNANTRYNLNMTAMAPADTAGNTYNATTLVPKVLTLSATPVRVNEYVGSLDAKDYYKFTLATANTAYTVSASLGNLAGSGTPTLKMFKANGSTEILGENADGIFAVNNAAANSVYYIEVARGEAAELSYTLNAWGISNTPTDNAGQFVSSSGTFVNAFAAVPGTLRIVTTDAYKNEGAAGTNTPYVFSVYRDGDLSQAATAQWAVSAAENSTVSVADFATTVFPSGIVSFAAAASLASITVSIKGDAVSELDELFKVTLSNPSSNLALVSSEVTGRIRNDDSVTPGASVYSIAATDQFKLEANTGTTDYVFTVTRDGAGLGSATESVGWTIDTIASPVFATVSSADFTAMSGTVNFTGTQTSQTITLKVVGDTLVEPDEYFKVSLVPNDKLTANASAVGVIRSNEVSSSLAAKAVTLTTAVQTSSDFVSYSSAEFAEEDWYKVTLGNVTTNGGGRIVANLSGLVGNADLTLYSAATSNGVTNFTQLAASSNLGALNDSILSGNLAAGIYYVRVSPDSVSDLITGYALDLKQVARDDYVAGIEAVQAGGGVGIVALSGSNADQTGSLAGKIELAGDVDWFRVSLTAGTYTFSSRGKQGTSDSVNTLTDTEIMGIYNSSGVLLPDSHGDDSIRTTTTGNITQTAYTSDAQVTLQVAAGDYYVAATAYGTLTGSYTLQVSSRNEAPVVTNPIGDQVAPEGGRFVLRLPWNVFSDPEGQPLILSASLRDGSPLPSWLNYDAAAQLFTGTVPGGAGDYSISLTATDPGFDGDASTAGDNKSVSANFTIRTPQVTDDYADNLGTNGMVAVGGSVRGRIDPAYDVDWIKVALTQDQTYTVDLRAVAGTSRLTDPMIMGIYGASGTLIDGTSNDDFGDSLDSRVTLTARNDGNYYIAVTGSASSVGNYSVSVSASSGGAGNLAPAYGGTLPDYVEAREGSDFTYVVPGDAFTDSQTLSYSAKLSDGSALPTWLTFTAATRTFTATKVQATINDLDVRVTATDTYGLSTSKDVVMRTVAANEGQGTWTLMVYLAADNDLEQYALKDLNEMEAVALSSGVKLVVLVDRNAGYSTADGDWKDTRQGLISQDSNLSSVTSKLTSLGELDTGSPTTLTNFINWTASNYRAANYGLVIWDHGGGLSGTSWDFTTTGRSNLSVAETTNAISSSILGKVDFLGFDTCLQGMVEQAVDVRNVADYVVASQDLEPGDGWDYSRWLNTFALNASPTDLQLATSAVNAYGTAYQNTQTLSAVDTSRLSNLTAKINEFISATEVTDGWSDLRAARTANEVRNYNNNDYIDLGAYMDVVGADADLSTSLRNAALSVSQALDAAVVAQTQATGSSGLSVFLPGESAAANAADYSSSNFSFLSETRWASFAQNLASSA